MLVVPLWQQRDSHLSREDVTMTSLAHCTKPHSDSTQEAHVAATAMRHLHTRSCVPFSSSSVAGGSEAVPLLSVGRHQRRRTVCNYNRQSKTKPFTFNEFLLEKGRLPQGGILMKQMAECSQGQTQTVLLFTLCQHFQHSEKLHLSLDRSLCALVCVWCACVKDFCLLTYLTAEKK